jgi:hypothetical protein
MSPDPYASNVPNGMSTYCSGTDADTLCPPQLYVRQEDADGIHVRWISRAEDGLFGGQEASLTGSAFFEAATPDGDKVFFRTNSPLTVDDPNGAGAPAPSGGVTTGTASQQSWDLYMYDFPNDPNADPGDGDLARISSGPEGGDCNSPLGGEAQPLGVNAFSASALRFLSDDGSRAYFTCAAPLAGADTAGGTVTSPGGDVSTAGATNLYLYDSSRPHAQRWRFVVRLPRSLSSGIDACATTGTDPISPLSSVAGGGASIDFITGSLYNCVRGTSDGKFVTFWTRGRLTSDDPGAPDTADVYAYDADTNDVARITAPQGGDGATYPCGTTGDAAALECYGDGGFSYNPTGGRGVNPPLGLATDPLVSGDRTAFFQSRSRLLPEDEDDAYDVYQWHNGDLSLLSTGASDTDGALYLGNDRTGRNVYFVTRDRLTWQDFDAVADVYTARVGGGIPEPPPPAICDALAGQCQGGEALVLKPQVNSGSGTGGNATPGARKTIRLKHLSDAQLRRAARTGVLTLPRLGLGAAAQPSHEVRNGSGEQGLRSCAYDSSPPPGGHCVGDGRSG